MPMHVLPRNRNPTVSVENDRQDQIPLHSAIVLDNAVTKLDFLKF